MTVRSDGKRWEVVTERPPPVLRPTRTTGLVNLNISTQAELEGLPGVGPALARRIIAGRPYRSVEDLGRVKGIGAATMGKLRPLVTARQED